MSSPYYCDRSDFCYEFSGGKETEFKQTYPDGPESRILLESEHFLAVSDVSPMLAGHCLIVPRQHAYSLAEIMISRPDELSTFLELFLERYGRAFGPYSLFEHGSTRSTNPAACVTHAHLHIVPLEPDLLSTQMTSDGMTFTALKNVQDLAPYASEELPYYLIGNLESGLHIALDDSQRPRQYFRLLLGRILDIPADECDWALVIRRDLLLETLSVFGLKDGERVD
ncbi:HIT family protein [Pseudarthrobacter phenanthrenivorans]|uniref:HIT family protein n=1 Tax=Pseudarthrobacter phenanthrenivorans TaxID=361575 RepID=A0A3B0FTF2_PSEPS|nr:HIT family protein [Pseudarthrobacter phenanthrenivorans]RKO26113.1 HIT family protein [Pseudarthrobacter phenanthrenivorans]